MTLNGIRSSAFSFSLPRPLLLALSRVSRNRSLPLPPSTTYALARVCNTATLCIAKGGHADFFSKKQSISYYCVLFYLLYCIHSDCKITINYNMSNIQNSVKNFCYSNKKISVEYNRWLSNRNTFVNGLRFIERIARAQGRTRLSRWRTWANRSEGRIYGIVEWQRWQWRSMTAIGSFERL